MANEEFFAEANAAIKACDKEKAIAAAKRGLAAGIPPDELLKKGFVVGISEMGDLFERGEVFLPELVLAADAMMGAAEVCNAALPEGKGEKKGTVVIGTVQGDVHDIGKTIVVAFLRANGYDVHDLGRDVAAAKFIDKAAEVNADVVGMSALLTTTMREQIRVLDAMKTGRRARQVQGHRRRRRIDPELGRQDRRRCLRGGRQRRREEDQRAHRQLTDPVWSDDERRGPRRECSPRAAPVRRWARRHFGDWRRRSGAGGSSGRWPEDTRCP